MDDLYSFVYRGVLTEEALDRVGRRTRRHFGAEEAEHLRRALSYNLLDDDALAEAERMSVAYIALHAFENTVREFVQRVLAEKYEENWWDKAPNSITPKIKRRIEEDEKAKWHGTRGSSPINYCDFGDLSAIIVTNFDDFEPHFPDNGREWVKSVLKPLEPSRNATMHGAILANEDIERIGVHVRDWIRQIGS